MTGKYFKVFCITGMSLFISAMLAGATDLAPIKLPAPQMTGGRPLMEVLKDRRSTRSFTEAKLSDQTLSNLLWAAWGINRPEHNLHTAPSATNAQEIDIYVTLEKGLYLYEPKSHELKPVLAKDLRGAAGMQSFVKNVPVNLVYVADYGRMRYPNEQTKDFYSAADTGHISQNVYLFCASEGLGAVIRGLVNKDALAKEMNLRPDQKIVLSQSVGYPRETAQEGH
jgi:SagB-type dehydrogenase family enzyme